VGGGKDKDNTASPDNNVDQIVNPDADQNQSEANRM